MRRCNAWLDATKSARVGRLRLCTTNHGRSVGGLTKGLVVELSNGAQAVVLEVGEATVKLDANHMMAGRSLTFELELVGIDRP